jgi:hypothetical protein
VDDLASVPQPPPCFERPRNPARRAAFAPTRPRLHPPDRVAVERKTGADLAASIRDRRLFEQTERLTDAYEAAVLIVEDGPHGGWLETLRIAGQRLRRRC